MLLQYLRTARRGRRFFAGAERCLRASQVLPKPDRERMRYTEHLPRGTSRLVERRHGFAKLF